MQKILNYIGGELRTPQGDKYLENKNPSRGVTYSLVPDSDERDVQAAVQAAEAAAPAWGRLTVDQRAGYLRKLAQKIAENADALARAETEDSGKPLSLSRTLDIPRAQQNFEFFADEILQLHGTTYATDARAVNYVHYSPLGAVGCISPWNLPLYLLTWKIAPAMVTGNTVVAKPSELTPMTAYMFSRLAQEAGLPPGVLNIVHGLGQNVGAPLVQSSLRAISFTGSTATGRSIAVDAAKSFKKVSLEMGGKNANIIFADCDFEKAIETTVRSSFLNQGQICLCGSRIFVEKSIYAKFKEALLAKTKDLQVGDPLEEATNVGAVVSEAHMQKILSYIQLAREERGKILCGGERAEIPGDCRQGYFVQPTLIEGLSHNCRVNQEEIFGPVATLIPFEREDEVISMANSTKYGLSASVWTKDHDRAQRVARALQVGTVWINAWMLRDLRTPFGGMKESGVGREGGVYGLQFFSEIQNICVGLK